MLGSVPWEAFTAEDWRALISATSEISERLSTFAWVAGERVQFETAHGSFHTTFEEPDYWNAFVASVTQSRAESREPGKGPDDPVPETIPDGTVALFLHFTNRGVPGTRLYLPFTGLPIIPSVRGSTLATRHLDWYGGASLIGVAADAQVSLQVGSVSADRALVFSATTAAQRLVARLSKQLTLSSQFCEVDGSAMLTAEVGEAEGGTASVSMRLTFEEAWRWIPFGGMRVEAAGVFAPFTDIGTATLVIDLERPALKITGKPMVPVVLGGSAGIEAMGVG